MTGARQPPTPDHPAGDDDVPAPGNSGQRPVEESSRRLVAGRYRLDTMIGRGSTGTVWAATDQLLRRRVALKKINLPRGMPAEAAQLQQRTLREARAAAALSSPHVITVFDILPATPTGPVIVMELLDGQSLAQLIQQRGRLPPGQAATIGVAVASALLAAHATGITHRDVKPGNVLITGDGFVKLTDFGIARDAAEHTITGARVIPGSPAYLAPEIANGAPAGPASDAWSLGGTLYACVEGRPPFDKGTPIDTVASVVNDPVPPHPHAAALGPAISGLLVKSPSLRMTITQALTRLRGVADDPSGTRTAPPPARPTDHRAATPPGPATEPIPAAPPDARSEPGQPGTPRWRSTDGNPGSPEPPPTDHRAHRRAPPEQNHPKP
jgi:eukaryotic-like serine/threonine-protein kinase